MASHTSNRKDVTLNELLKDEFFQCGKCEQTCVEPLLLNCLHSLCRGCIGGCGNHCPTCQAPLEKGARVVTNHFLVGLAKLRDSRSDSEKHCDYCRYDGKSKASTNRCVECGDNLCENCSDAHKKTKVTRGHSLLPFEEIRKGKHDESIRLRQRPMCVKHKEELLRYFCLACRVTLCRECMHGDHDGHSTCSLDEAALSSRESIELLLENVKSHLPQLEEYGLFMRDYETTLEENEASLREKIERCVADMHEAIERQKSRLLQQLADTMGKEKGFVQSCMGTLHAALRQVHQSTYFVDALMKHGRNDEVLPMCDLVTERLRHFLELEFEGIQGKLVVQFLPGTGGSGDKSLEHMVGRLSLAHSTSGCPSIGGAMPTDGTNMAYEDDASAYYVPGSSSAHHPHHSKNRHKLQGSTYSVDMILPRGERMNDSEEDSSYAGYDEREPPRTTDFRTQEDELFSDYQQHSRHSRRGGQRAQHQSHHQQREEEQDEDDDMRRTHFKEINSSNYDLRHSQRNLHVVKKSTFVPKSLDVLPQVLPKVTMSQCFDAASPKDTRDIWPTGVAFSPGSGDIYILDRDNRSVKVFSRDGNYKFQFGGRESGEQGALASPYDLAISPSGMVFVTDYQHEQVKCYRLNGDYEKSYVGHFKHPRGICVTNGGRFVVADCRTRQVSVHEPLEGKPVLTIRGGRTGESSNSLSSELFTDPYYVASTADHCLVVTDWAAPNLKIFDPEGDLIAQTGTYGVNQEQMLQPYGVCCDENGYIIVADNANHRLHLLAPNGTFIKFLITKEDGIWHPMAVCVDNKKGELIVTEALGKVKVFHYI